MKQGFWRDRPVLVTGATGLVGAWLTRRLLDEGASVICLVRDWVPRSELVQARLIDRVTVVRGDVRDRDTVERAIGEYETETVIHLAAQTIVGIANRNPVSTFESNIQGTWNLLESCRRSPLVKSIVIASSADGRAFRLPHRGPLRMVGRLAETGLLLSSLQFRPQKISVILHCNLTPSTRIRSSPITQSQYP